jgi:hypothetical protein
MKEMDTRDEQFFRTVMAESKLELPFSDFEDTVMAGIENKADRPSFSTDLKLSWIFFIAGSVFGIALSVLLPRLQSPVFGIQPGALAILFQVTFTVLLFTQLETLIRLVKKLNTKA